MGQPMTFTTAASVHGSSPTFSWSHTVPTYMPWSGKQDNHCLSPVMRFTAPISPDPCTSQTATSWELLHNLGTNGANMGNHQHLKRKSESEDELFRPNKIYISEEKMAAWFSQIDICGSNSTSHLEQPGYTDGRSTSSRIGPPFVKSMMSVEQLNSMLAESRTEEPVKEKGELVLAPELKKMVEKDAAFFQSLMSIQKPSLALVPWQPPKPISIPTELLQSNSQYFNSTSTTVAMATDNAAEINNNTTTTDDEESNTSLPNETVPKPVINEEFDSMEL
ncbi:uncharacterized protein LOC106470689 isoform X2 [Limulus polyphemus]|nr:uncharacterized protein LOC106470689 isoform X2 [Limulus polyphemus]